MKILVLSLLRMGDVLLHEAALQNIRKDNPQSEIQVLINDVAQKICPVITSVDRWWIFPRKTIQNQIVQAESNPNHAFSTLSNIVEQLNQEKFDVVYNLSHTKFSARFMDLIQAKVKKGIFFENGQVKKISNSWLKFFNDYFSKSNNSPFHYSFMLNKSVDLGPVALYRDVKSVSDKPKAALQVLTSDTKKNWGLENWRNLLDQLKKSYPDWQWWVLGSPQEKQQLQVYFSQDELQILDFKDLSLFFKECAYLITGDTSVQHMAAREGVKILSLFLGSANIFKTAACSTSNLIVSSDESCFPCWHADPCHRSEHFCGKTISPQEVLNIFSLWQRKEQAPLEAWITKSSLQFHQSISLPWQPQFLWQLGGSAAMKNYQRALSQLTWQIYLDKENKHEVPPYGSAAMWFTEENIWNWRQNQILVAWLNRRDLSIDKLLKVVSDLKTQISQAASTVSAADFAHRIFAYNAVLDIEGDYFFRFHQVRQETAANNFLWFNQIRQALIESEQLLLTEKKLLSKIWNELEGKGINYVPRITKLSEASSIEA